MAVSLPAHAISSCVGYVRYDDEYCVRSANRILQARRVDIGNINPNIAQAIPVVML